MVWHFGLGNYLVDPAKSLRASFYRTGVFLRACFPSREGRRRRSQSLPGCIPFLVEVAATWTSSQLLPMFAVAFREGRRSRLDLRLWVAANQWRRGLYLARGLPPTKETTPKRPGHARNWCRKTGRKRLPIQKPTPKYAKGSLSNAKFTKMANPFAKLLEEWFLSFCQITQMPN